MGWFKRLSNSNFAQVAPSAPGCTNSKKGSRRKLFSFVYNELQSFAPSAPSAPTPIYTKELGALGAPPSLSYLCLLVPTSMSATRRTCANQATSQFPKIQK